jgi:DNA mismatch endonuclease (patch repair protein)
MADSVNKAKRSEIMRSVKTKNTTPETLVRKFLFSKGFRFRIHCKTLSGTPDIVLKKYRTIIFINGCFWHGHDNCKLASIPKSNTAFWQLKIDRNKLRDNLNVSKLQAQGWNVIIIWGCQLKKAALNEKLQELVGP